MKFDFEKFKQSLLDNETITTDEMELTIKLVSEFIETKTTKVVVDNEDFILINKKVKNIKLINTDLRFQIEQGNLLNQTLHLFGKVYRPDNLIDFAIDCNDLEQNYYYYSESEYLQDVETLRKVFKK